MPYWHNSKTAYNSINFEGQFWSCASIAFSVQYTYHIYYTIALCHYFEM